MANIKLLMDIDTAKAKVNVRELGGEMQKFGDTAEKSTERMKRGLAGVPSAVTLALAGVTAGLISGAAASVRYASAFDSAMTQSVAIMGNVSAATRRQMEETARSVARTTVFSAKEAADAYYFLASAGLSAEKSMKVLPEVAQFAQAGLLNMASATDYLMSAINALGLNVERDMGRVADVITQASVMSNTNIDQLSQALTTKAAAAMRTWRIEVEQGAAVLAVYADQGLKGSIAGERFDILVRELTTRARENAEAFRALGIEVIGASGNMNNIASIVAQIERAFGGMSAAQRSASLAAMGFRAESQGAILNLVGMSDRIRQYETALKGASGATKEIADKQMKSFSAQMGLLKKAVDEAVGRIGGALLPTLQQLGDRYLKPAAERAADLAKRFGQLPAPVRETTAVLAALGTAGTLGMAGLLVTAKGVAELRIALVALTASGLIQGVMAMGQALRVYLSLTGLELVALGFANLSILGAKLAGVWAAIAVGGTAAAASFVTLAAAAAAVAAQITIAATVGFLIGSAIDKLIDKFPAARREVDLFFQGLYDWWTKTDRAALNRAAFETPLTVGLKVGSAEWIARFRPHQAAGAAPPPPTGPRVPTKEQIEAAKKLAETWREVHREAREYFRLAGAQGPGDGGTGFAMFGVEKAPSSMAQAVSVAADAWMDLEVAAYRAARAIEDAKAASDMAAWRAGLEDVRNARQETMEWASAVDHLAEAFAQLQISSSPVFAALQFGLTTVGQSIRSVQAVRSELARAARVQRDFAAAGGRGQSAAAQRIRDNTQLTATFHALSSAISIYAQNARNASGAAAALSGAMQGAGAGAQLGAATGLPHGALIGGIAGALGGAVTAYFAGSAYRNSIRRASQLLGTAVSEELMAAIEETMVRLRVDQYTASLLNLDQAMAGGGSPENFQRQMRLLLPIARHSAGEVGRLAGEQFGRAFTALLQESLKNGGRIVSDAVLNMIAAARESGVVIPEIESFIDEQIEKVIRGTTGLLNSMRPTTESDARALAAIFSASFWAVVRERGIIAASDAFRDVFHKLMESFKSLGLDASSGPLGLIGTLIEVGADKKFRAIAEAADAAATALSGLANLNFADTNVLRGTADLIVSLFEQAMRRARELGLPQDVATRVALTTVMQLLSDYIATMRRGGLPIDPRIQQMINDLRTQGIVPLTSIADLQFKELQAHTAILERIAGIRHAPPQGGPVPGQGGGGVPGTEPPPFPRTPRGPDAIPFIPSFGVSAAAGFGPRQLARDTMFLAHAGEHVMVVPRGMPFGFKSAAEGFFSTTGGVVSPASWLPGGGGGVAANLVPSGGELLFTGSGRGAVSGEQLRALTDAVGAIASRPTNTFQIDNKPTVVVEDRSMIKTREGVEEFNRTTISLINRALRNNEQGLRSTVRDIAEEVR